MSGELPTEARYVTDQVTVETGVLEESFVSEEEEEEENEADRLLGGTAKDKLMAEGVRGGRWVTLTASCLLMIVAGNIYAFGVWSEALSEQWPLETRKNGQATLNTLYEFTLIGLYMPIPGFFFHRFGPVKSLWLASLFLVVGYSYILVHFFRNKGDVNLLSVVAFFLVGHATGYMDVALIGCNVHHFSSRERGSVLGLLKGYFGLSASVLTLIHSTGLSYTGFLLLLGPINASWVLGTSLIAITDSRSETSKVFEHATPETNWKLKFLLTVEISVALLLFIRSITASKDSVGIAILFTCLVGSLFLLTPFVNWIYRFYRMYFPLYNEVAQNAEESTTISIETQRSPPSNHHHHEQQQQQQQHTEADMTMKDAVMSIKFWILFPMFVSVMGSGLFIVGNSGRLVTAKGGGEADINSLVSIVSVSNCLGRVFIGIVADHSAFNHRRSVLLFLTLVVMSTSHILFSFIPLNLLWIPGLLGGGSYGASWALMPILVADIFGTQNFGKIYAIFGLAPMIGSIIFSIIATVAYNSDENTSNPIHGSGGENDRCLGNACFATAHLITVSICLIVTCFAGLSFHRFG